MKKHVIISALVLVMPLMPLSAQERIPYVYDVENSGSAFPPPVMLPADKLPVVSNLRNPLLWSDNSGLADNFVDWERRRNEIAAEIQHYEIGTKPSVSLNDIKSWMSGDTLFVEVKRGDKSITLTSEIRYPKVGNPPYSLLIGTSGISLPHQLWDDLPLATMIYHESQVNDYSQWRKHHDRGEYEFDRLYPELIDNGAYSEWSWGISRLIDGLQKLGTSTSKIDTRRIGVTGCSYAGKMALFCGAFDERIALTITQEPGGGGAAAWRVSNKIDSVESLDRTDYHWFKESLRDNFAKEKTFLLPYDHHELCAMVCPRALLMLGNTDYKWLADESGYVSMNAASKVWQHYGIADRVGYSIVGGHPHCMLPESQYDIVRAFIRRFLFGHDVPTAGVAYAPDFEGKVPLSPWISEGK